MKRRNFGFLASTSLLALKFGQAMTQTAMAQTAADPSLLKTTLTPFGAERAGNADNSIPAWTGGYTNVPAGWQPGAFMPLPDEMLNERPVAVINASNMAQYASGLTAGVMAMMSKYGYSIQVYPTHRSAAAPQAVYDAMAANLTRARLNVPSDPRLGFSNAFGGPPFPIPDISDPLVAGAQIISNHRTRWQGYAAYNHQATYVVTGGAVVLSSSANLWVRSPYYLATDVTASSEKIYLEFAKNDAPPNLLGEEVLTQDNTDDRVSPTQTWLLLNGQGRVRKAPETRFDTPSSFADGLINYDEYVVFTGSMEKYDWKYLGKKEIYIPYHNNQLMALTPQQAHLLHFLDPNAVRWELHRVWVVEATLHPGERNILARRMFYVDEDTWTAGLADAWDANNNLFHVNMMFNVLRPDLPGTVTAAPGGQAVYNLQSQNYTTCDALWNEKAHPTYKFYSDLSQSMFDPEAMAASAQY